MNRLFITYLAGELIRNPPPSRSRSIPAPNLCSAHMQASSGDRFAPGRGTGRWTGRLPHWRQRVQFRLHSRLPLSCFKTKEKWELNFILNGSMYCPIPVDPFLDMMSFLVMEATTYRRGHIFLDLF